MPAHPTRWYEQRIPLPLTSWPLAALVAAFLLPGLIGHDPWKTEDALGIGIVHQMLESGDWLRPMLAGEPFYEDGPLFYWVAAMFVKVLGGVLAPHDAARFASALFVLTALWFIRLAARELYGKREGDLSTLAFMGAAGFMWHAHEATAETAMIAGLAAAYYGVAISHRKPYKGGIAFGVGAGVAFLAKGLTALAQPLAAVLLVLPISAPFRQRSFALAVGLGLVVLAPFALTWPALLAAKAPDYFAGWIAWQIANVSHPPAFAELADVAKTFAWSLFPVWPMTLWATWGYRRSLREPGFAVPFAATIVSLVLLLLTSDARDVDMLALLVPLSIPAGVAAIALRRGAANALAWFAMMTFSLGAAYLWLMWAVTLAGAPERLARTAARLEPGFVLRVEWVPLVFAALITAAWFILIVRAERSTLRSLTHWAAGMTLTWGLATTLWLGWIDYAKSYRAVAESLKRTLPATARCVESRDLGETQRAVFHYHAGLLTRRAEVHGRTNCPYLLVQSSTRGPVFEPEPGWVRIWEGGRPRDRERYRLYRRTAAR